jgi:hypothetical protein
MQRFGRNGFQDQQIQCALSQIGQVVRHGLLSKLERKDYDKRAVQVNSEEIQGVSIAGGAPSPQS